MRNNFLIFLISVVVARETYMLIALSRHSAKYSSHMMEDSHERDKITPYGLRMAYTLGKYLNSEYFYFFPDRFNFNNDYILASNDSASRITAQAILMGLYDIGSLNEEIRVKEEYFKPEWKDFDIETNFKTAIPEGLQPVPVHSYGADENWVFESHLTATCPKLPITLQEKGSTKELTVLAKMNQFKDIFKNEKIDYQMIIGSKDFIEIEQIWEFFKYVESKKYRGHDLGLTNDVYEALRELYTLSIEARYLNGENEQKYMFTEHAMTLIEELEALLIKLERGEKPKRFLLHVGSDITLFLYLSLMNFGSGNLKRDFMAPEYSSLLTFEVYSDNGYYVDINYNGQPVKFCSSFFQG